MVLALAVVYRLWREKLAGIYGAFGFLLLFDVAATITLRFVPYHTNWYGRVWMATEAVKLLIYAVVTLEIYDVALRPFPGILRAARTAVTVSLVLATLIALLTLQIDLRVAVSGEKNILPLFLIIQRSVIFTLAVFQILILAFLSWFPIRLSWNARLYATLFIVFFICKSMSLLAIILLGNKKAQVFSIPFLLVWCACEAGWALFLRQDGEDVETSQPLGRRSDPTALTAKLESLNERLSKSKNK
jgi:hypothetical protein